MVFRRLVSGILRKAGVIFAQSHRSRFDFVQDARPRTQNILQMCMAINMSIVEYIEFFASVIKQIINY